MKYRSVLVALDLSEEGDALLDKARWIADDCGAVIRLIHVVEYLPLDISEDYAAVDSALLSEEMLAHAREVIHAQAAAHDISADRCHIELGSTKAEVKRVIEETDTDLLVVGRHSRHGLALLLGSTARSLLGNVDCDVLAVHVGS